MTEEEYEKWKEERERPTRQEQGIDWGMGEDAGNSLLDESPLAATLVEILGRILAIS